MRHFPLSREPVLANVRTGSPLLLRCRSRASTLSVRRGASRRRRSRSRRRLVATRRPTRSRDRLGAGAPSPGARRSFLSSGCPSLLSAAARRSADGIAGPRSPLRDFALSRTVIEDEQPLSPPRVVLRPSPPGPMRRSVNSHSDHVTVTRSASCSSLRSRKRPRSHSRPGMSGTGVSRSVPIASAPMLAPMDGIAAGIGALTTNFSA